MASLSHVEVLELLDGQSRELQRHRSPADLDFLTLSLLDLCARLEAPQDAALLKAKLLLPSNQDVFSPDEGSVQYHPSVTFITLKLILDVLSAAVHERPFEPWSATEVLDNGHTGGLADTSHPTAGTPAGSPVGRRFTGETSDALELGASERGSSVGGGRSSGDGSPGGSAVESAQQRLAESFFSATAIEDVRQGDTPFDRYSILLSISPLVADYAFSRLRHGTPLPEQTLAAHLLGLLSAAQLDYICALFSAQAEAARTEASHRLLSITQRAWGLVRLGFQSPLQTKITERFYGVITSLMRRAGQSFWSSLVWDHALSRACSCSLCTLVVVSLHGTSVFSHRSFFFCTRLSFSIQSAASSAAQYAPHFAAISSALPIRVAEPSLRRPFPTASRPACARFMPAQKSMLLRWPPLRRRQERLGQRRARRRGNTWRVGISRPTFLWGIHPLSLLLSPAFPLPRLLIERPLRLWRLRVAPQTPST